MAAGPAQAISWGTIYAYDDSNRLVASGYGTVFKSTFSGDQLAVRPTYTDRRDNSHAAYTQAKWYFNGTYCYSSGEGSVGCGSGWYSAGKSESSRTTGTKTVNLYKPLKGTADSARAGIQVCEDQGTLNPDECTYGETFRGISY